MKQVPFYPNHGDDMHCMLAAYASVLDYFLGKKLGWKELEELTGFQDHKAVWTVQPLPKLAVMGLAIRMIEPFDYAKYLKDGEAYLQTLYTQEEIDWYKKNSDLTTLADYIPAFLDTIDYECRRPQLADIDAMLAEDRLVFVTVNWRTLHNKEGFASHAILLLDKEGDDYIAHDPGSPPQPYLRLTASKLWEAMGGDENTAEVTGFKKAANA